MSYIIPQQFSFLLCRGLVHKKWINFFLFKADHLTLHILPWDKSWGKSHLTNFLLLGRGQFNCKSTATMTFESSVPCHVNLKKSRKSIKINSLTSMFCLISGWGNHYRRCTMSTANLKIIVCRHQQPTSSNVLVRNGRVAFCPPSSKASMHLMTSVVLETFSSAKRWHF